MKLHRDKIIEHMANAMIRYDAGSGQKTWRELATVAYYAYINCIEVVDVWNDSSLLNNNNR